MSHFFFKRLDSGFIRISKSHFCGGARKQNSHFFVGRLDSVCCSSTMGISEGKSQLRHTKSFCGEREDVVSSNKLITEYARNGRLDFARQVFDKMRYRDVVSWTAMVTGYAQNGRLEDARLVFDKMPHRNVISWNAMIAGYTRYGRLNDACLLFDNMHERDMVSWTLMIVGYARNGRMQDARKVFDEMPERNIVSWNAMITGYAQNGRIEDARHLFDRMPEQSVVSWTAMIAGYCDNGKMEEATELFDKMPKRSVVTWTAMIAGCTQNGLEENALSLFSRMILAGINPNASTFTSVLNACTRLGALEQGYTQHGRLKDARWLFDEMPEKDVVTWTVMISGHAHKCHGEEALKLFNKMKREDIKPNRATLVSILSACATLAVLDQGKQIHGNVVKTKQYSDIFVGNSLVTMYSKCGSIDTACQVFEEMSEWDVISWTAIITGFAQHGRGHKALELFKQMQQCGIKPNYITFLGVLTACSHSCLLDEGWQYFYSMTSDHGIIPGVDHYACMVDLLGRLGLLNQAEEFINKMPLEPDPVIWKALLGGCRIHGNLEVGERVAKQLFKLEPQSGAAYVLLSNMYAAVGRWNDVTNVRAIMKDRGVEKEVGYSWIEINNIVHAFTGGDRSHPQIEDV